MNKLFYANVYVPDDESLQTGEHRLYLVFAQSVEQARDVLDSAIQVPVGDDDVEEIKGMTVNATGNVIVYLETIHVDH